MVFDITDQTTFSHVNDWFEEIRKNTKDNVIKILVGNKLDLNENRQLKYEEC